MLLPPRCPPITLAAPLALIWFGFVSPADAGPPPSPSSTITATAALDRALHAALVGIASPSIDARLAGASAAAELRHPLFVHPLRGLLLAPEPPVRRAAARALGELGIPRTSRDLDALIGALRTALSDPDPDVSTAALEAFARYPFPEVRRRLVKIAGTPGEPDSRRAIARRALASAIGAEQASRLASWLEVSSREALETTSSATLDEGLARPETRFGIGRGSILLAAHDLLDPDHPEAHTSAVAALAASPDTARTWPFLARALLEPEAALRRAAATALAGVDALDIARALLPALRDSDVEVRASAIGGAGRHVDPEIARALVGDLAHEPDEELQRHLIAVIEDQEDAPVLEAIDGLIDQGAAEKSDVAGRALDVLAPRRGERAAATIVRLLAQAPTDPVADRALQILRDRSDDEAAGPLLDALGTPPISTLSSTTSPLPSSDAALVFAASSRQPFTGTSQTASDPSSPPEPPAPRLEPPGAARSLPPSPSPYREKRILAGLAGRTDGRIAPRLLALAAGGGGSPGMLALLATQPESAVRPGLVALVNSSNPSARAFALDALVGQLPYRGRDVLDAAVALLDREPAEDRAFELITAQDGELSLDPLLSLLGRPDHGRRHGEVLHAMRGRSDPRLAEPVTTAAIARPDLAPLAIEVLRSQPTSSALPQLARLASAADLPSDARAGAIRSMQAAADPAAAPLLLPLASDPEVGVRMAARNALHGLDPARYPSWDPYGRVPLIVESAAFGAAMLLLSSDIADAKLSPAFTGAVGLILGGATPYLLTLDEDVSLGDAGYFGTLGLWSTLGGFGLAGALDLGDKDSGWLTLAGEALGLGVGGLTMSRAEWGLGEVGLASFAAIEAGLVTMGVAGAARAFDGDSGRIARLGLFGGALGMAPIALLARRLEVKDSSLLIGTSMGHGAWLGLWAPGLLDRETSGGDAFLGALAGQGLGFFTGLVLAQAGAPPTAVTARGTFIGAGIGSAIGAGLGLFVDADRRAVTGLLEAGSAGGALAMGLLAEQLEIHDQDLEIVVLSGLLGTIAGGQFEVRLEEDRLHEPSTAGGVLLGAGLGTVGGLVLSQLVDASPRGLHRTVLGGLVLAAAGSGLGRLIPDLRARQRTVITGAHLFTGLALTGFFAEQLPLSETETLGTIALASVTGGLYGSLLSSYWRDDDESLVASQVGGGLLFGSALGAFAGGALDTWLDLERDRVGLAAWSTAAGTSAGAGLGLLAPGIDRRGTVALMHGVGLASVGAVLASDDLFGEGRDGETRRSALARHSALFAVHGALHGALIPYTWRTDPVPGEELLGGVLFGSGLGVFAGYGAARLLDSPLALPDVIESSLLSWAADALGGGVGLMAGEPLLAASLVEVLGLAGLAGAVALAPSTSYDAASDGPTIALGGALLGWFGGWLPSALASDPEGSQTAGGVLAGSGLGVLSAAALTQLTGAREEPELLGAAAAGSAIGSGLGLLAGLDRRGTVGLMEGAGLLSLGSAVALAPSTTYDGGDGALLALGGAAGAWHGALLSDALALGTDDGSTRRTGGLLLGAGAGLLSAAAIGQIVSIAPADVLEIALLSGSASAIGGGLAGSLPEASAQAGAIAIEVAGLSGLALGALVAPSTDYDAGDRSMVALLTAAGTWNGAFLPLLWDATGGFERRSGAFFGGGLGFLGGALLSQITSFTPGDALTGGLALVAGSAAGGGLGLLLPGVSGSAHAALIDGAGAGALAAALALAPELQFSPSDRTLVGLCSAIGAWHGAWLSPLARDPGDAGGGAGGGALLGAGAGAIAGAALAQGVELDTAAQVEGALAWAHLSAAGAGLGLLSPSIGGRGTALLLEGAGLVGLAAGLLLADHTTYSASDRAMIPGGALFGAGFGLTLPTLLFGDDSIAGEQRAGGALLGAGLAGIGAAALAQATEYEPSALLEIGWFGAAGAAAGYGLGLMIPGSSDRLRLGLTDALGATALGAALLIAPLTEYDREDALTVGAAATAGSLMGAFLPSLWNGPELSDVPGAQSAGGGLLGAGLGAGAGILLSEVIDPDSRARELSAAGATAGALAGSGLGLLFSEDDRLFVGLGEGLLLLGAAGTGLAADSIHMTGSDLGLGAAYVGYLTWHELGLSLLLEGTDRQAAGATMATFGLGTLTGMFLVPYLSIDLTDTLMLLAGNVWGSWIGGWGGVLLKDHLESNLDARRAAGLYLLSTVLGSDLGLALTGLVVSGLVDMPPTRFAVINLSGLGGMMIGMLAAGFAKDEPLKAGNVIGSLGGLVLGTVITGFFDWSRTSPYSTPVSDEKDTDAATPEIASRGFPIQIESWMPEARVEPTPEGERYTFGVTGTFR